MGLGLTIFDKTLPEKRPPYFRACLTLLCKNYADDSSEKQVRLSPTLTSQLPCSGIHLREQFKRGLWSEKRSNSEAAAPKHEQSACRGCWSRTPLRGEVACAARAEETTEAQKRGLVPPQKKPYEKES